MKRQLTRKIENIFHIENGIRIPGPPPGVWGDLNDITGDLTNISGNLTGVWGNLSGVSGDLTGAWGNLSGVIGDLSGALGRPRRLSNNRGGQKARH